MLSCKVQPTDINVISPAGFGLDERAQEAISRSEFEPGRKDGKPVRIRATIEVTFRFLDTWFDQKTEHRRTEYNLAVRNLDQRDEKAAARALETILRLSQQNFIPAVYLEGLLLDEGRSLPRDPERALKLFQKAADKHYGPALYEIGKRHCDGRGFPADPQKGLQSMRDAAARGSKQAQFELGARYAKGDGVEQDPDRSRRYYALRAAAREAACEYQLARSLLDRPGRQEARARRSRKAGG